MTSGRFAAAILACALAGVAGPSSNRTTEFTGTLQVGGTSNHTFQVSRNGEYDVRITAFNPPLGSFVGIAFGQLSGAVCVPLANNSFATVNRTVLSGPIFSGTYCVAIYDVGALTQAHTYTIRVSHP
jgi:hypothetical protein